MLALALRQGARMIWRLQLDAQSVSFVRLASTFSHMHCAWADA